MKIEKIIVGSWFPKISIHLKEFQHFLNQGQAADLLDNKIISQLRSRLKPKQISFVSTSALNYLSAASSNYKFNYFEDGLLLIKSDYKNFSKDKRRIFNFYNQKLAPCLAYLFSSGAKGLEIVRQPGLPKKCILVGSDNLENEIAEFINESEKASYYSEKYKGYQIYYSQGLIFLNFDKKMAEGKIDQIIQFLIFNDELKSHVKKLLSTHRIIWDQSQTIISKRQIRIKNLRKDNYQLTQFKNTVGNIRERIEQMKLIMEFRQSKMQNQGVINFDGLAEK